MKTVTIQTGACKGVSAIVISQSTNGFYTLVSIDTNRAHPTYRTYRTSDLDW